MSITNQASLDILAHIFENASWSAIGDASGLQPSATEGDLYISLHTASPTESGDQTTNEAAYTDYDRVAIGRGPADWDIAADAAANAAAVTFPIAGVTAAETITHFGVGTTAYSGAGNLLFFGALTTPLNVDDGVTPNFAIGTLTVTFS